MTRDEAVSTLRIVSYRLDHSLRACHPQAWCDQVLQECAEDTIDGLIALGILKVDDPPSPQGVEHE